MKEKNGEKMFCGCLRKLLLRGVGWSRHWNAPPHPPTHPPAHPPSHPPLSQKPMTTTDTLGLQMITCNQYTLLLFFDSLPVELLLSHSLSLSLSLSHTHPYYFIFSHCTYTHACTQSRTHTPFVHPIYLSQSSSSHHQRYHLLVRMIVSIETHYRAEKCALVAVEGVSKFVYCKCAVSNVLICLPWSHLKHFTYKCVTEDFNS